MNGCVGDPVHDHFENRHQKREQSDLSEKGGIGGNKNISACYIGKQTISFYTEHNVQDRGSCHTGLNDRGMPYLQIAARCLFSEGSQDIEALRAEGSVDSRTIWTEVNKA